VLTEIETEHGHELVSAAVAEFGRAVAEATQADEPAAAAAVVVRFLLDGERFEWQGSVYRAEDTPVVHEGIAIVPVWNEQGDNTWIELPADAWVVLRHGALADNDT
jgi:hypothetical protein